MALTSTLVALDSMPYHSTLQLRPLYHSVSPFTFMLLVLHLDTLVSLWILHIYNADQSSNMLGWRMASVATIDYPLTNFETTAAILRKFTHGDKVSYTGSHKRNSLVGFILGLTRKY